MWSISFSYYIYFKIRNNAKYIGAEYLPKRGPFILIGNHSSGADAYLGLSVVFGRLGRKFVSVAHEKSFKKDTFERALLLALDMIPRIGTGDQILKRQAKVLLSHKIIASVPEGMLNNGKIMKAYTGTTRLYYYVNSHPKIDCPIVPLVSIGAFEAYPPYRDENGKYHPKRTGIIGRFGKPFHLPPIPEGVDKKAFYREQTDYMMNILCDLALQKEGVIDSWKIDSIDHGKTKREYKL